MLQRFSKSLTATVGVVLCAAAAVVSALVGASQPWGTAVPLGFVLVLVLLALRYGTAVGIFGSILAAGIFAYFYAPVGSFQVESQAARTNLGWMVLASVALSYLLVAPAKASHRER